MTPLQAMSAGKCLNLEKSTLITHLILQMRKLWPVERGETPRPNIVHGWAYLYVGWLAAESTLTPAGFAASVDTESSEM